MILAQRIRLAPNNVQASFLERCAGAARFTYNWGLARWQEIHAVGGTPSWRTLNAEINARKDRDLGWLRDLPWAVPNTALADLGRAFGHFFRRVKAGQRPGYPRFKAKKRCTPAFAIEGRAIHFDGRRVHLPKLGWVRTRQPPRFPGRVLSARFSKHAGHWDLAIQVEIDETRWTYPHRCETQAAVGVDLGVVDLAVLSTGEHVPAPRSLRHHAAQLRRLNKELSRRTRGGQNWQKTKAKLGLLHEHIAHVRHAATHALTASLVHHFRWIGIEDLHVAAMMRGRLATSLQDAAMAEVRRQLAYKAPLAGSTVVVADRFYPSSKTCATCGVIYADLALNERRWTCESCGAEHDRDENAAENLYQLAAAQAVTACRHESAGALRDAQLSLGQESGHAVSFG
ncbi:MAG: RNA-guided endonuclease TnpB family protein [bacterium]